jgi:hypothetical protein
MVYRCTCLGCGLIVRTELPEGEKACVCIEANEVADDNPQPVPTEPE